MIKCLPIREIIELLFNVSFIAMYIFATALTNVATKTARNERYRVVWNNEKDLVLSQGPRLHALRWVEEINETCKLFATGRKYWATARVSSNIESYNTD